MEGKLTLLIAEYHDQFPRYIFSSEEKAQEFLDNDKWMNTVAFKDSTKPWLRKEAYSFREISVDLGDGF